MKKLIAVCMLLLASTAHAAYDWKIVRAVDGDTVEVEPPWMPVELGNTIKIRIYGIDTPEKGGRAQCESEAKLGESATEFTKKFLANAKKTKIELKDWDKFGGRILGDVIADGKSLRAELIKAKLAREYFGDAKKSWCN